MKRRRLFAILFAMSALCAAPIQAEIFYELNRIITNGSDESKLDDYIRADEERGKIFKVTYETCI